MMSDRYDREELSWEIPLTYWEKNKQVTAESQWDLFIL